MNSNNFFVKAASAALVAAGMLTGVSCVRDDNYKLGSLDNVDPSMTLFSGGIELPIGHTENITVANLLKFEGMESLDSLIKRDSHGNCSISAGGDYNLDEIISQMHLEKLSDINGASFTNSLEYKIGDINPDQFKIAGTEYSHQTKLSDFNLDDIPMPEFSCNEQVKAGMDKYLPSDMDLGKRIGDVKHSDDILDIGKLSDKVPVVPGMGDVEVSVQQALGEIGKTSVGIDYSEKIQKSLELGSSASQIQDITNFKLSSGGCLKVNLSIVNCPLMGGQITPDLDLDISSMFKTDKIDLSSMTLTSSNGWKAEKTVAVSKFADTFPEYRSGTLVLDALMSLCGNVCISGATSTANKIKDLSDKTMTLEAVVSLDGVVITDMDITLGAGVSCSIPDVTMPLDISYDLPQAIRSVEKVYFKDDRKISLQVSASNISNLKTSDGSGHLSIVPDVVISFPKGLEVEGAVDGKVTIPSKDLYTGDIVRQYTLVSVTPAISGGKLTFSGNVTAKVSAAIGGSFSSKALPSTPEKDVTVTARIDCYPQLKDYDVTLDKAKITKEVSASQEFSFSLDGLSDFGSFRVELKDSPVARIVFDVPATTEMDIVVENLKICLPSMLVVDASAYESFDVLTNTLTLNGKLPSSVELPIRYLKVTPEADPSGKTLVKGTISASGAISISDEKITRKTFDELNSKDVKFTAVIPSMEADAITLEGDFNKSLDYEGKDVVFLDAETIKSLPKEVKSIKELDLENVNAIIEISLSGLPDLDSGFHLKGTSIQLPDFLYGENDTHTLILDDDIEIADGKASVQKACLTKIKDINLEGVTQVTGDIKFVSSLYSHKPSVDVSTLKSTVKATVKIGVGNGSAADHPGKIAISEATVRAGYNMNDTEAISFGDVPEELRAEDVNLALNPQMHLNLATNFCAPVRGDFVFTPYSKGKALEAVTVKGIELPCSDDPGKTLVNKYAIGSSVTPASDEILIAADLSKLLTRIPDSIVVAMNVAVDADKDCKIYPSAKYTCNMDYEISVPISFGDKFNLDIASDIDIEEDISDIIKMSGGKVCLKGTYANTLPIGLDFTAVFLDKNEKVLSDPVTMKIAPSSDGTAESVADFALYVSFKDSSPEDVSKLRVVFKALASADVNLNEKQYIRLDGVKIQLLSGLTLEEEK